jgi:hypothetical protein
MRLTGLLADFDPAATEFLEQNEVVLRPIFSDDAWKQFGECVANYSFADARAQLEQALKTFPTV